MWKSYITFPSPAHWSWTWHSPSSSGRQFPDPESGTCPGGQVTWVAWPGPPKVAGTRQCPLEHSKPGPGQSLSSDYEKKNIDLRSMFFLLNFATLPPCTWVGRTSPWCRPVPPGSWSPCPPRTGSGTLPPRRAATWGTRRTCRRRTPGRTWGTHPTQERKGGMWSMVFFSRTVLLFMLLLCCCL